jgi:PAS domain S-box-containing protein
VTGIPSDPRDAADILDSLLQAYVRFDQAFRYTFVNKAAEQLLGKSQAELLGNVLWDVFPGLVGTPFEEHYRRSMAERVTVRFENLYEPWQRWYEISAIPSSDGGIVVHFGEITGRKQAEELLRQRVKELAALNELGRAASSTLALGPATAASLRGVLEAVHPDVAFLFLRDGDRLILEDLLPSAARARMSAIPEHRVGECMCGLAVREKKPLYSRDIFKDLRCTWEECKRAGFRSFAALPLISSDEVIGVIGLASDGERDFERQGGFLETLASQASIALVNAQLYETVQRELAERKQAEVALRESEERYAELFEWAPLGYHSLDADGRILIVNEAWLKMLGYTRAEVIGKWIGEFFTPVTLEVFRAQYPVTKATGRVQLEFEMLHKSGERRLVRVEGLARRQPDGTFERTNSILQDITESRRAEEALRESEERLRSILQTAMDGFWRLDTQGRLLEVNETYCRMSGYSAQELLQFGLSGLEVTESPSDTAAHVQAVVTQREDRFETRHRRKDGSVFEVEVSAQYQPARGGEIVAFLRDITERKRAQARLAEAHDTTAAILGSISDAFFAMNNDMVVTYFNRAAEAALKCKAEDVVGHGLFDAFPEARGSVFEKQYRRALDHKIGVSFETYFGVPPYDDWYDVRVYPNPDGISVYFQLITERKRAEKALRESEQRFRLLVESSPDAIVVETGGRFAYVNRTAVRLFGADAPSALLGQTVMERLHPDDREAVQMHIQALSETKSLVPPHEERLLRLDGTPVPVEVRAVPIHYEGSDGALVFVRDITERNRAMAERERLQEQLTQAQKMESIGRLAGGVAHDFNNLLTVINGYSSFALAALAEGDPLRNQLEQIQKAGDRAAGLTRQLLAFSRKQILQPQVLALNRVVVDLQSILRRLVGEDVEVLLALSPENPTVRADPHQLEQVIMNLAVNARDAMPGGGTLTIETMQIEHEDSASQPLEACPGAYAILAVSDTGEGMDEATRQRIFEPFFTTKTFGEGTGLGLSMVQGIVAQSGGYIEVTSEPGRGSTFRVCLPMLAGTEVEAEKPTPVPTLRGEETILVVEDQTDVREFAVAVLRSYGYRVIEAAGAGEALAICERDRMPVNLVLADIVMPQMGGRELVVRLEQTRPGIKALFMSGYTDDVILHHGGLAETTHFIQKPFSPNDLARKVRALLGSPARGARILVADDEAGVRSFLRAVLEAGGHTVSEAADGREVLSQARLHQVDLVITDLMMPGQEGIETIQTLRREVPGIGIIAVSGAFGGHYLRIAERLGADGILNKPVKADVLQAKVAEVLASRQ